MIAKNFHASSPDKRVVFLALDGNDATARRNSFHFPCQTLTCAFALAHPGDTIRIGSGTYDLGDSALKIPDGVSLDGNGEATLTSVVDLDTSGAMLVPGTGTNIRGLTLIVGETPSGFGACIGSYGQNGFTDAHIEGCHLVSTSDIIYFHHQEFLKVLTISNSTLEGKWDGISLFDGNYNIKISDSFLTLAGPPERGDQTAPCHAVFLSSGPGGKVDIQRCKVSVSGPNSGNRGILCSKFAAGSLISVCGSSFQVSGPESRYYEIDPLSHLNLAVNCP